MKKILYTICTFLILVTFASCRKFLDAKPDQKMTTPNSLEDCDALLDDRATMNSMYPVSAEIASDDYYLVKSDWESIYSFWERDVYAWNKNVDINYMEWQGPYKIILIANQVLEVLEKINRERDLVKYDRIKGSALFFRAYALSQLATVFTGTYQEESADRLLGLPLRLKPGADEHVVRSSLRETYEQIINDAKESYALLPVTAFVKTRPSKGAAQGLLARIYLEMGEYMLAKTAAEKALEHNNSLMNYSLQDNSTTPFERFNVEVIFHASTNVSDALYPTIAKIDSVLYKSYSDHDLRKTLFFGENEDGTYSFKGRYDGQLNGATFCGIAVDELYLILAETSIRNNELKNGFHALNELMVTRWDEGKFVPFLANSKEAGLSMTLQERRKQLLFRNIRWADLKRLNLETAHKKTLIRKIGDQEYDLVPNDLRYTFLIPLKVMGQSKLEQNPR